jgi:hypothetical protein
LSTQTESGRRRPAWLTFAAVVLIAVGCARIISAIYYFADSDRVSDVSSGPFAHHLIYWGVWDLFIAALALSGGLALLKQKDVGFVLGYGFAGLLIVQSLLMFAADPWYAFAGLILAILIIHALATSDAAGGFDYGRVEAGSASRRVY